MRKFLLALSLFLFVFNITGKAQNQFSFHLGYLRTRTFVAEYERINHSNHLLDSVWLNPNMNSFTATLATDFDLGNNFVFSAGFHYSKKGLQQVVYHDTAGWPWSTEAYQHYAGISMLIGYKFRFSEDKWGLQLSTGPQVDFSVGTPNGGTLFSGPYYIYFMPFCRINEVDMTWAVDVSGTRKLGPGDIVLKLRYLYGLSDVLEDPFVVGRSMSFGVTLGYAIPIGKL